MIERTFRLLDDRARVRPVVRRHVLPRQIDGRADGAEIGGSLAERLTQHAERLLNGEFVFRLHAMLIIKSCAGNGTPSRTNRAMETPPVILSRSDETTTSHHDRP